MMDSNRKSENMMLVSVVIPAFNEHKHIASVIKALQAQTYSSIEIIVIDNASTDDTSEIANSFGVVVLLEKQKGTNFALECGRRVAKGEIIARLDADSVPDADWVAKGAKHFLDKNVSAVTGPYDYYDGTKSFRIISLFFQRNIYFFVNWIFQVFHVGAIITGGNSMMRASDLEKIGGFDTSITFYGDDTDVAKRLSKVGCVVLDRDLMIKSSARRFQTHGVLKICWLYFYYFLKMTFFRSSKKS